MRLFKGLFLVSMLIGVLASYASAGADLRDYTDRQERVSREEPPPVRQEVVQRAVEPCIDWHCAQGNGAHFNLPRPCGDDTRIISEWDHRPVRVRETYTTTNPR